MKILMNGQGLEQKDRKKLREALEELAPRLRKRLGRKAPQDVYLRATMYRDNGVYYLTLSLHLPEHPVVAQKQGLDIGMAVREAEEALRQEMGRSLARIRKEHLRRRRHGTREALTRFTEEVSGSREAVPKKGTKAATPPLHTREGLYARLRPLLEPMYGYAQRMLEAARASDDLHSEMLEPEDLVDQAVVTLLEDHQNRALENAEELEKVLYRNIDALLADEIARQQPGGPGDTVSLSRNAPQSEQWENTSEREEEEFYMPFELLKMEDVLIDDRAEIPSDSMTEHEEHRDILKRLGKIGAKARSAFFLNRIEGFELYEIAMIQSRDEKDIQRDIDRCVEALRGKVEDAASLGTDKSNR